MAARVVQGNPFREILEADCLPAMDTHSASDHRSLLDQRVEGALQPLGRNRLS